MDRLEGVLQRAQWDKSLFAVMFIDVDRFKQVNDSYGHHVGDKVREKVASRAQAEAVGKKFGNRPLSPMALS